MLDPVGDEMKLQKVCEAVVLLSFSCELFG
jgi:hypothetical protein